MSEINSYTKMQEDLYNKERKLGKYAPEFKEDAEVPAAEPDQEEEKDLSGDGVKIWPFKKKKK